MLDSLNQTIMHKARKINQKKYITHEDVTIIIIITYPHLPHACVVGQLPLSLLKVAHCEQATKRSALAIKAHLVQRELYITERALHAFEPRQYLGDPCHHSTAICRP